MHTRGMAWTDERKTTLVTLWNEGLSRFEIAARIGCGVTPGGVATQASKLRLPRRPSHHDRRPKAFRAEKHRGTGNGYGYAINRARKDGLSLHEAMDYMFLRPEVVPTGPIWEPLPGTTPISLMDLPASRYEVCRWPVTGGFCGQPSGERTYCDHHHAIAYRGKTE